MSVTEFIEVGGALIEKDQLDAVLKKGIRRNLSRMTEDLLNNFEILEPPKRTATLRGEVVDLSMIPAIISLKFIGFSKKYDIKKLEGMTDESFDPDMVEDMVELVAQICIQSNPTITKDWLLAKLGIQDLMKFIQFTFSGMTQLGAEEGGSDGKNLESGT